MRCAVAMVLGKSGLFRAFLVEVMRFKMRRKDGGLLLKTKELLGSCFATGPARRELI